MRGEGNGTGRSSCFNEKSCTSVKEGPLAKTLLLDVVVIVVSLVIVVGKTSRCSLASCSILLATLTTGNGVVCRLFRFRFIPAAFVFTMLRRGELCCVDEWP